MGVSFTTKIFFLKFLNLAIDILKPWFSTFKPQSFYTYDIQHNL